jgi:hypothetical protein
VSAYREAHVTPDLPPPVVTPDLQGQGGPGSAGRQTTGGKPERTHRHEAAPATGRSGDGDG